MPFLHFLRIEEGIYELCVTSTDEFFFVLFWLRKAIPFEMEDELDVHAKRCARARAVLENIRSDKTSQTTGSFHHPITSG